MAIFLTNCCLLALPSLSLAVENKADSNSFWAFQPPVFQAPPVESDSWVDGWIQSELRSREIPTTPKADRATRIRRLYLDLTGLLPTPGQTLEFVRDPRPDSEVWPELVETALADPGFGERWGRHWLDVARYAESVGRTRNYPLPHAWKYRDYVIDALNRDLPFDQFIREQIAGDLLPSDNDEAAASRVIATGFLALGSHDLNERNNRQFEMDVVDEQIDVITRGFMALTVACARCHDHKFDPIPTKDYYAMAGILRSSDLRIGYSNRQGGENAFSDSRLASLPGVVDKVQPPKAEKEKEKSKKLKRLERQLSEQEDRLKELQRFQNQLKKSGKRPAKRGLVLEELSRMGLTPQELNQELRELRQSATQLKRQVEQEQLAAGGTDVQATLMTHALALQDDASPVDCPVHIRGEIDQLGERVPRGFVQALNSSDHSAWKLPFDSSGRLELADWIANRNNPLTARVIANRVWSHLMGRGIVRTVDNFGMTGDRPTHPELLDSLAVYFMDNHWSVKSLVRLIVSSESYQRASDNSDVAYGIDPENVYYWRMTPKRLEAEVLRDTMLQVSGALLNHQEGPSPVAQLDPKELNPRQIDQVMGFETSRERSVYLPVLRGYLPAIYEVFDFPDPSQVMGNREVTTVSTQALYMMNHPMTLTLSESAARKLIRNSNISSDLDNTELRKLVRRMYGVCLCRTPSPEEMRRTVQWIEAAPEASSLEEILAQVFQAFFAGAEFRYVW